MQAISAEVRGVRPPRQRASIVKALLASSALVNATVAGLAIASTFSTIAVIASTSIAHADGGAGGDGTPGSGGAGGVGNSGAPGVNGNPFVTADGITVNGGGGGGGASGGGHGGASGEPSGGLGGAGGTLASPNGAAGGTGAGGGGGFNGAAAGTGGAGGNGNDTTGLGINTLQSSGGGGGGGGGSGLGTGGNGGAGGRGGFADTQNTSTAATLTVTGSGGGGGGGGDGGIGNLQTGLGFLNITTSSVGGIGGAGGTGGTGVSAATDLAAGAVATATAIAGAGGNGGNGGTGLQLAGGGLLGASTVGGNGGAGGNGADATSDAIATGTGATPIASSTAGAGGKGGNGGGGFTETGSNVVVGNNFSTITGGNGGAGGIGGDATTQVNFSTGFGVAETSTLGGAGGNGGSGGGAALFAGSGVSFTNSGTMTGGNGGAGGNGGNVTATFVKDGVAQPSIAGLPGNGGIGGAGGTGVLFSGANSSFNNTGTVTGGNGGNGGNGDSGGNAGVGGAGVVFGASGATLVNSGSIHGGGGASGGDGPTLNAPGSTGGIGVLFTGTGTITNTASGSITGGRGGGSAGGIRVGEFAIAGGGLTIANSGTISGGFDGVGISQQFAIALTGGANFIGGSGVINGGIQVQGGSFMPALPGSTVGTTLNAGGPVSFAPGTTYAIRVNGAANDAISGGVMTVSGANVSATVSGNLGSVLGQHTIITGAAISGTFASVANNSAFLQAALSYDPTHVFLTFTGNGPNGTITFTPFAQTGNQTGVAGALNAAGNANGFSGPLINLISGLSASQASSAFTALDGEVATGAERASFRFMDQFLNLMLDPFVDGRFGNGAGGATGFAPEQQAALPAEIAQAYAETFKAPPPANFEQRWSLWGVAFGGSGKTGGNAAVGSSDTTLSTFGYASGLEYRISPDTTIGFAAAGGGTNWGLANALGTGRSDSAQVGAYARTRAGAAYIAESIAFANHWFTTDRTALGDSLRANFTGQSFGGRLEGGYRIAVTPNFGITPYAAGQAQAFHSGAYSETDTNNAGFGLSYAARTATDIRTELGARFDNPTLLAGTPLIIHARFAWAHDYVDTPSAAAAFQALPLSNFTVLGAAIPQNSGLASVGTDWYLRPDWKLATKFDGEFASRSNIYAGSVALRHSW